MDNTFGKTVTICAETVIQGGNTVSAVPNCMTGLDTTQQFTITPGQLKVHIQNNSQLIGYADKYCSRYVLPNDQATCRILFEPIHIQGDITPIPNSDFGKSLVTP